ncbi:sigma-70 family RNA polymerase sigma factor [Streptomyces sp. NPDC059740]|uniref:sigma-70 family RNA polymerase sigma factor n=1 Tax=Streptomyces sp. NPDC059740 TaxID=3346926 RepID=UPI003666FDBE
MPSQGGPRGPEAPVGAGAAAVGAGGVGRGEGGGPPEQLPPSDETLLAGVRAGEEGAFEELYLRHAGAVRRYARTCCRDAHTAEDLTGEVFASTLQAVRGGAGPDTAVRPYLLTAVRRVAANWARTVRREELVEDFAVFAVSAAGAHAEDDTVELGADVRAMHQAEQSLAVRAFQSLPERYRTVLWHTTVEKETPREVAPILGLTPNATAVLAHRAREGLRQAYLQAHVNASAAEGPCARYADRLGAYARGGLRTRAERGLRKHLEECARCRSAALEVADINERIGAVLPVAVLGWLAAGYAGKVAVGAVAGAGAAGAGAATGAASGHGAAAAGGGASTALAGSGSGGSAGGGSAGVASEGLGAPVKAGIASAVVLAVAGAALALTLTGQETRRPTAGHRPGPVVTSSRPPSTARPSASPSSDPTTGTAPGPSRSSGPVARRTSPPASSAAPAPHRPGSSSPRPTEPPAGSSSPSAPPGATTRPTPSGKPPVTYALDALGWDLTGDGSGPEIRTLGGTGLWQRGTVHIGGRSYPRGASVHPPSSVTVDLHRPCTRFRAVAGVDDLGMVKGPLRFSVYADGALVWSSPVVRQGDPATPVSVPLAGRRSLRLVVRPASLTGIAAVGSWAQTSISCSG